MLDNIGGYEFTDEAALRRIKIDGDILPGRSQHQTLRSEDVAYVHESIQERKAAAGRPLDATWLGSHIPRITEYAITHETFTELWDWHTQELAKSRDFEVTVNLSGMYDGVDLTDAIAEAADTYNATKAELYVWREDELYRLRQEYREATADADGKLESDTLAIQSEWQKQGNAERQRYQKEKEDIETRYYNDTASIQRDIENIQKDESLTPLEKQAQIKDAEWELAFLGLKHEKDVFDSGIIHETKLLGIDAERTDAIAAATAERDGAVEEAERIRDEQSESVAARYESGMEGAKAPLRSLVERVLSNPLGFSAGTVFDANGFAEETGLLLPAEVERRSIFDETNVGYHARSAFRSVWLADRFGLHQGLQVWALFSDLWHMQALTGIGAVGHFLEIMQWHDDPIEGEESREVPPRDTEVAVDHDGLMHVALRNTLYGYYKSRTNTSVLGFCESRKMSERDGWAAWLSIEFYSVGDIRSGGELKGIDSRYLWGVIPGTVTKQSPEYHKAMDAVDDAYAAAIAANAKEKARLLNERKDKYDLDLEDLEGRRDRQIENAREERDGKISDASERLGNAIYNITKSATTKAWDIDEENPRGEIQKGLRDIENARKMTKEAIDEAEKEYKDRESEIYAKFGEDRQTLIEKYEKDVASIESTIEALDDAAEDDRRQSANAVNEEYMQPFFDAEDVYRESRDAADREREIALQQPDPDYNAIERTWVRAYNSALRVYIDTWNSLEPPTEKRLRAEFDWSAVYGKAMDVETTIGSVAIYSSRLIVAPPLRTLNSSAGDFSRFDEYYDGPTGAQTPQS